MACGCGWLGLLTGCGTNGDFGRMRPSLVNDDIHAWMGPAATRGPATLAWRHQLTDEERTLARPCLSADRAALRSQQMVQRARRIRSPAADLGRIPIARPMRRGCSTTAYRSQTARYNRLIEDIRNDLVRLDPFFATARYVVDMDRKREKALAYVTGLTRGGARQHAPAHRGKPQHRAVGAGLTGGARGVLSRSRSSGW